MQTIIKDGIYIDLFFEFQPFCLCFVCGPRFLLVEFYPEEFTKPQSRDKHRGMDERLSEWLSRIRVRDRILLKLIPLAYSFNILTSTPTLLNTIFRLQNLHILLSSLKISVVSQLDSNQHLVHEGISTYEYTLYK